MSLPVINAAGVPRKLGALPPHDDFGGFPRYATRRGLLPRTSWEEFDLGAYSVPVLDQGQHGSCVGHGSCSAFWFMWCMSGFTVPSGGFSPTSIYARINGGQDNGAIVSDAMRSLVKDGVSLMRLFPESEIYGWQESPDSRAARERFKAEQVEHVDTFDALGSCLTQFREPIVFGVVLPPKFEEVDSAGIPGFGVGKPLGGHCMCAFGLKRLATGGWAVRVRNSWGTSWGLNGDCFLTERFFTYRQPTLDAFRVVIPAADPQDPDPAPVAA